MCLVEHAENKHKLSSANILTKQQTKQRSSSTTFCSTNNNTRIYDINTQQQQQQEEQQHPQQHHHQSLLCDSTHTPTFNAKYRRKCLLLLSLLLFHGCFSGLHSASAYNCNTNPCQNDGQCLDGQCICADGWQGPACQFCGGKVRLVFKYCFSLPPSLIPSV